ncbi:LuxR C-terminal-related transcriptional regulator [Paraburkholderia sp. Ac-20336]|uniref:helix-turn-helix domain-containing protein n=1 Tax=Paraburkholderia sp. Ac-20336 TaxID=2703886 RepID=UPI001F11B806|nr:LuxR C-terminal-related transcriptional regulator [Paraburkholderia sp. Ac-20336]
MKTLSCIISEILRPTDLADQLDRFTEKVREVVEFDRCVILHERKSTAISHGMVYRYGVRTDQADCSPGRTLCGPAVDLEQYLNCFTISNPLDHAFQWQDCRGEFNELGHITDDVASHMRGGEGVAACVRSSVSSAEDVGTVLQLECADVTVHLALLVSFIAMHLHATLAMKIMEVDQSDAGFNLGETVANPSLDLSGIRLTRKERDVIKWVIEGKTAWEIGKILCVSERTVKFHLTNVYEKLKVSNRAQAVAKVSRLGLI